jgi:hypothetical protein
VDGNFHAAWSLIQQEKEAAMKQRPTPPRIKHLKQEVAMEKRRRNFPAADERKSSRYLVAVAGAALLVGILATGTPVATPPSSPSIAEMPQP